MKDIIQRLEELAEARKPDSQPDVRYVAIERRDFLPILRALKAGQEACDAKRHWLGAGWQDPDASTRYATAEAHLLAEYDAGGAK